MTKADKINTIREFLKGFTVTPKSSQDVELAEMANMLIPLIVDQMSDDEIDTWATTVAWAVLTQNAETIQLDWDDDAEGDE